MCHSVSCPRHPLADLLVRQPPHHAVDSTGQSPSLGKRHVLRYLDIGESRHATTNRYKHKPYCTRVPSCTYSTFCDVIRLIIRVLSSRGSIISNNYMMGKINIKWFSCHMSQCMDPEICQNLSSSANSVFVS